MIKTYLALAAFLLCLFHQIANHSGYVQVDWKKVEKDVNKAKKRLKKKANKAAPEINTLIEEVKVPVAKFTLFSSLFPSLLMFFMLKGSWSAMQQCPLVHRFQYDACSGLSVSFMCSSLLHRPRTLSKGTLSCPVGLSAVSCWVWPPKDVNMQCIISITSLSCTTWHHLCTDSNVNIATSRVGAKGLYLTFKAWAVVTILSTV